jgi:hypothetical protein
MRPFRGSPAARPPLAIGVAGLIHLGRVNALANVFASDNDCVTVDDPGRADDIGLSRDGAR